MSNRFTKATPVEYLPIDTSLMYKAGLAKDEQIQEGIDAAQKGVDALANMKSSYTTDHNYVNSYYDGVMSNLREKVKNTASFNDPNFKSNINQVINESSSGNGHIAGSGPVDYNEGKILFLHIRKHKPKLVLEIGTASGCSAVIMARALELNKIGKLHTVDISTDNYEEGININGHLGGEIYRN